MEIMEKAAILGVTGFVGRGLPTLLAAAGMSTTGISRAGSGKVAGVAAWQGVEQLDLAGHSVVINLAGEPIDRRWTAESKRRFHESRVGLTNRVVAAISKLPAAERPRVLVNASAVGIYGDRGDEVLGEAAPRGEGYLADLCGAWEAAAMEAEALGVRVVRLRIGIVLGQEGAAFQKLMRVFKLGVGGKLGSGNQWMPWIHVADLRAAIVHAVGSSTLAGAVNGTAPEPERNEDFTRKLASAGRRPAFCHAPGFALKIALGGFGGALLAGQRALPLALEADGFRFRYPTLERALGDLIPVSRG
jgi:uncharacterized protein (TIGR01777 family)